MATECGESEKVLEDWLLRNDWFHKTKMHLWIEYHKN